jgi:hypothetical protein
MRIFDWFKAKSSNVKIQNDVIWLTKASKLKGIAAAMTHRRAEQNGPGSILLVAHFPDCLEGLEKIRELVEQRDAAAPVIVASAVALKETSAAGMPINNAQSVQMIVGERHPLLSHDDAIVEFAQSLPCRVNLVYHLALDDAVMRVFGGDWVVSALKRLGMKENESIESQMVVRRIRDAQKKLGRESIGELPADSAESWMELNCPNVWFKDRR